jgi:hypothetical protein
VAILRHPMAMAASLAQETGQKESDLWDYALEAYATIAGDLPFLHAVMVLRYEDIVGDPERTMRALHMFLDLPHHPLEVKLRDANAEFDMQGEFTPLQAVCAEQWGYGDLGSVEPFQPIVEHPLRECRAAVRKCLGLENPPARAESSARNRRERAFSHSDS